MSSYYNVFGVDTGVHSTANSAEVRANVRLRLAVGGEAGIMVEEAVSPEVMPRFVAIYFSAGDLIIAKTQDDNYVKIHVDSSNGTYVTITYAYQDVAGFPELSP